VVEAEKGPALIAPGAAFAGYKWSNLNFCLPYANEENKFSFYFPSLLSNISPLKSSGK